MVLAELHRLIAEVCPIDGVSDLGNGNYTISFLGEATDQQKAQANVIIQSWPLLAAKSDKLVEIDNQWADLEKIGWDSGQGYSLGIAPNDVALLVGAFSLAKEAVALGLPLPSLVSMNNTPITFNSIGEMTVLLLQYGNARATLSSSFAAKRKAVELATTIEEVINIL